MGKLKKALLAVGGLAVGIVTLRSVRKRRSKNDEDRELNHLDPETATEHAEAAAEHTRQAVKKAKAR